MYFCIYKNYFFYKGKKIFQCKENKINQKKKERNLQYAK